MPAQTQPLDVPLAGLQQASDVRVAPVNGTQRLENYRIKRGTTLQKRAGIAGPAFASGFPPVRATPLPLGGMHVLLSDGTCGTTADLGATIAVPFDPFPAPFNTLTERGYAPFGAPDVLAREAFASQGSVVDRSQVHAARTLNYLVLVASTNAGADGTAVVASVYHLATGALVYAKQDITPSLTSGEVSLVLLSDGLTDNVVLLSSVGSTLALERRTVSGAGLSIPAATSSFAIGLANVWDACLGNAGEILVVHGTGAAIVTARRVDYLTLATLQTATLAGTTTPQSLSVSAAGSRAALAHVDAGTNARKATRFSAATLASVTVTALGGSPGSPRSCAACMVNPFATGGTLQAVYLFASADDPAATSIAAPSTTATFVGALDGAGVAIGPSATWLGCRPSAKPFAPSATRCCVPLDVVSVRASGSAAGTSANPNTGAEPGFGTVVVEALAELDTGAPEISSAPVPLAWHNLARSSATHITSKLASPTVGADGSVILCYTALDRAQLVTDEPGVGASATTVRGLVVRYRPIPSQWVAATQPARPYTPAGATSLIGGALPALAEGCGVVPAGYLHPPEIVALRRTVTGTSAVWPTASIALRARYVWYDGRGNELTSAWSLPSQIATPTAVANTRVDVYARNPIAWPSQVARRPLIELAVQTVVGGPFVLTTPVDAGSGTFPSTQTQAVAFETTSALGLRAGDITTTLVDVDALPNDPPPAAAYVSAGRARWLLVSPEDNAAYYSKPSLQGVLPEWSLAFVLTPSESAGRPVAAFEFGDRIILLGTRGATYYVGDGRDGNGEGADFSGPYEAASGQGCISAASVCLAPTAAFWRSPHTIVSFDGSTVTPIGRAAQDVLDAYPHTLASDYCAPTNAVVWLLGDNALGRVALVYDLTHQAWLTWPLSTISGPSGIVPASDVTSDDLGLYFVGGNRIHAYDAEDSGTGQDTDGFPQGLVRTQTVRLGAVRGYQRVTSVVVAYESNHALNTLTIRLIRDGRTLDGPFTSPALGAGIGTARFNIPAQFQQCSTLAVQLEDAEPSDPDTAPAGLSLLGVTLEATVDGVSALMPATLTFLGDRYAESARPLLAATAAARSASGRRRWPQQRLWRQLHLGPWQRLRLRQADHDWQLQHAAGAAWRLFLGRLARGGVRPAPGVRPAGPGLRQSRLRLRRVGRPRRLGRVAHGPGRGRREPHGGQPTPRGRAGSDAEPPGAGAGGRPECRGAAVPAQRPGRDAPGPVARHVGPGRLGSARGAAGLRSRFPRRARLGCAERHDSAARDAVGAATAREPTRRPQPGGALSRVARPRHLPGPARPRRPGPGHCAHRHGVRAAKPWAQ